MVILRYTHERCIKCTILIDTTVKIFRKCRNSQLEKLIGNVLLQGFTATPYKYLDILM